MGSIVNYKGFTGTNGFSQGIWGDFDVIECMRNPEYGYFFFDDFLTFPTVAADTTLQNGYITFADTGCSIAALATEVGGVAQLAIDATGDNDSVGLGTTTMGKISSSSPKMLCWEARIRPAQVTAANLFIGLTEEGNVVDNGIFADAGTITNQDYVGFRALEADPDGLDAIHNDATGEVVVKNEAQVMVAATWYRVGCVFDETNVKWFVDGTQVGSDVLPTATDFPDGEELCLVMLSKAGGATAHNYDIDWWAFGQKR